jgi:O-antigen/teichoic acid export membrane protein
MKSKILTLTKNSFFYAIGSIFVSLASFVTLPIFTRYLTPGEFGVVGMLALLTVVIQSIFTLGLSAAMGPSYFKKKTLRNKSEVVWSVFFITLISSSSLIVLAWFFPNLPSKLFRIPAEYTDLVTMSITGNSLAVLATAFTLRVYFESRVLFHLMITFVSVVIGALVSVYAVVFLSWGVRGIIYGQITVNLILFISFFSLGVLQTKFRMNIKMMKDLFFLGIPLMPSFAFLFLIMNGSRIMLELHHGLELVGIYSVGFSFGSIISVVTSGITSAWYPFFMSYLNKKKNITIIFGKIMTLYFYLVGLIAFGFFIFAKPMIEIMTYKSYHEAYPVVGLIALAYFMQVIYSFLLPPLYFNKEIKFVSLIQGLTVIISLFLGYFLVKNYEILGAAFTVLLGNTLMVLIIFIWNYLKYKNYPKVKYELKKIFKISILFLILILIHSKINVNVFLEQLLISFSFMLFASLIVLFSSYNYKIKNIIILK